MSSTKTSLKLPSERSFGLLFVSVFAGLGFYGFYNGWFRTAVVVSFLASLILAMVTVSVPRALAPLNRVWFHLGQLLGKIVSPIVLGSIFYGLLTPIALIARIFGHDELKLKPRAVTSWLSATHWDRLPIPLKTNSEILWVPSSKSFGNPL